MSSIEVGPNSQNILFNADPVYRINVVVDLDIVTTPIFMPVSVPDSIIRGFGRDVGTIVVEAFAGVPEPEDVITTSNLNPSDIPPPDLTIKPPTFVEILTDVDENRLVSSQNKVREAFVAKIAKNLIRSSINGYKLV